MHLAFLPLAFVASTIPPGEDAISMALIVDVFSHVDTTVGPLIMTFAVHVVRQPVPFVLAPIEPLVRAFAAHLVVDPSAGVKCPIRPEVGPKAVLFSLREIAVIARTISPAFRALAVVQVVFPITDVLLLSLVADKLAETVRLVVLPVALVNVTIGTPQLSFAVCLVVKPFTFVLGLIFPNLDAIGTLASLFVNVTGVKSILHDFQIFDVLQIKLVDHLFELRNLFFRA